MILRKNITIPEEEYEMIDRYCKRVGKTFSEFLREAAMSVIGRSEETNLYDYLVKNVSFVCEEEQKEFEALDIDLEERGEELKVDDIL